MTRMPVITNNFDFAGGIQADRLGRRDGLEIKRQDDTQTLGQHLASGNTGQAARFALNNGMVNEGMKLQGMERERAAEAAKKKADRLASLVYAADTPDKWGQMIGRLKQTGVNLPDQYNDFGSRDMVLAEYAGLTGVKAARADARADAELRLKQRGDETSLMKNIEAAGLRKGTQEYRDAMLSGTRQGTVINNQIPGAEKGTNKLTEKLAEQAAGVYDQAASAQDLASKYSQINEYAQDPNVRTGTLGSVELGIKKLGNTVFGLEFDGLPEGEQIQKVGDLLVGDIRKMQGDTRMSDADRRAYRAIPPNIGDSKQGILLATEIMNKTAVGMAKRQQALSRLISENGGQFDTRVWSQYNQYINQNPLITREDVMKARSIAKGAVQTPPGAGMRKSYEKWLQE